jgi:hypothetical protein
MFIILVGEFFPHRFNLDKRDNASIGPNWVYIMNKGPWAMAHGFIQKVEYNEILKAMAQGFYCKLVLCMQMVWDLQKSHNEIYLHSGQV